MFQVLKGQIHLKHSDNLDATKSIINHLSSVLGEATNVPVYCKMFLLASNYHQRAREQHDNNHRQLEQKLNTELERLNRENESFNRENKRLNDKIVSQREYFDKKITSLKTDIEAKFTTEALQNFEDVISSQTEVSNLRKLNGKLLLECSQLRIKTNGLEDEKMNLEAKLETVITEQEQQKSALMLMGALLEKLSLTKDNDESGTSNVPTGQQQSLLF